MRRFFLCVVLRRHCWHHKSKRARKCCRCEREEYLMSTTVVREHWVRIERYRPAKFWRDRL